MTKALLVACLAVGVVGARLSAQSPRPTFEVVSIKKIDKPSPAFRGPAIRGGTLSLPVTDVSFLIQMAYGLKDFQVVGGPDWVRKEPFEVQAKAAGDPSRTDVLLMLQSLLADRFGLRLRKEQREMRYFALVLARDDRRPGPSLRAETDVANCGLFSDAANEESKKKEAAGHSMVGPGCGLLSQVADLASRFVEMPVFDRTGLTGNWGGWLYYAPDRSAGREPDPNLPSFTSALRDQFGLKLESMRGPVEVHVIDAVHQPTEN